MTTIYIAGPMSGIKDWNFPAFFKAEAELEALGYKVINPAHNDGATVQDALESAGLNPVLAEVTMKADNETVFTGDDAVKMQKLLDALDDLDDVQEIYTSAVIEE